MAFYAPFVWVRFPPSSLISFTFLSPPHLSLSNLTIPFFYFCFTYNPLFPPPGTCSQPQPFSKLLPGFHLHSKVSTQNKRFDASICIWKHVRHLCFGAWVTLLGVRFSSFLHSFICKSHDSVWFYSWIIFHCNKYRFLNHSSVDAHLNWVHH